MHYLMCFSVCRFTSVKEEYHSGEGVGFQIQALQVKLYGSKVNSYFYPENLVVKNKLSPCLLCTLETV